jgi:hypothetical protein
LCSPSAWTTNAFLILVVGFERGYQPTLRVNSNLAEQHSPLIPGITQYLSGVIGDPGFPI